MLKVLAVAVCAVGCLLAVAITGSSAQTAGGGTPAVSYRLAEFDFGGSTRIAASGSTTFRFWNAGRNPHNFTIVQGPTKFASNTLTPNQTQNLTVDLKPGAYLAICTIRDGGHMVAGMHHIFTVGTQNQQTGEWTG
jgi:plastocyanin